MCEVSVTYIAIVLHLLWFWLFSWSLAGVGGDL